MKVSSFRFRKGSALLGASLALLGADRIVTQTFHGGVGSELSLFPSAFACGGGGDPDLYLRYRSDWLSEGSVSVEKTDANPLVADHLQCSAPIQPFSYTKKDQEVTLASLEGMSPDGLISTLDQRLSDSTHLSLRLHAYLSKLKATAKRIDNTIASPAPPLVLSHSPNGRVALLDLKAALSQVSPKMAKDAGTILSAWKDFTRRFRSFPEGSERGENPVLWNAFTTALDELNTEIHNDKGDHPWAQWVQSLMLNDYYDNCSLMGDDSHACNSLHEYQGYQAALRKRLSPANKDYICARKDEESISKQIKEVRDDLDQLAVNTAALKTIGSAIDSRERKRVISTPCSAPGQTSAAAGP